MDALADRMLARERRAAARWVGIAVAAAPALEQLEDGGWLAWLGELAHGRGELPVGAWASVPTLLYFVALGLAAAWLSPRLRPRDRWLFLLACVVVEGWHVLARGLLLPGCVAVLAFAAAASRGAFTREAQS
ncbi:MAG: hypothetical protein IPH07_36570 [Deltaproteobacteria bacterium]|nr:hypothetical protein [Deltaproteobacteria bacterium]MBK8235702.1 hypothetical protein [Deltaproteobacteria bacterium]MBK8713336.1 hypothetical protein [Deltaproteobacteria bacterium]MBP7289320.1 hypothetical protein [Nannocystaceae bacterium]